ncbi:MAG: NAD-dependent epimerase/dehydratase family protein [Vicinamibacterales bacterium]
MTSRWHGSSVLITGAGGFIGANLARRLVHLGARVHAVLRPSTPLWRLEDVVSSLVIHRADMTERVDLERAVRRAEPAVVFHLAAQGASRHGVEAAQLFHTNVVGTLNLLVATECQSVARFVQLGGSSEYGPRTSALCETDRLEPVTPYGVSKAAATLTCQQYARANGRGIVILRPFSVYGPWEAASRLIPTAMLAALEDRELPLTPLGYRRDLVYVDDVVDACLMAAVQDVAPGEILNVGTGRHWTNEEVISTIERVCGRPIRVRVGQFQPRLSDTSHWVADTSKTERVLGWKATRTLEAGLAETVAWFVAQRERTYARE